MKKIYVILFLIIVIIGLNIYVYFNNKMPTQELSESEIKELFYNIKKYNNIYVETITEGENFKQVSKRYQKNGIILTKEPDEKNTYIYWVNTNTNESLVIQEGHKVWYKSEIDDEDKNNYKFIEYEKYNKAKCAVVQITTGNNETNRNTNDFIDVDNIGDEIIEIGQKFTRLSKEKQKEFHLKVWIFTHGLATLVVTKTIKFTDAEIEDLITSTVRQMIKGYRIEEGEK